jgi:hypothetical protein
MQTLEQMSRTPDEVSGKGRDGLHKDSLDEQQATLPRENRTGSGSDRVGYEKDKLVTFADTSVYRKFHPVATAPGSVFVQRGWLLP